MASEKEVATSHLQAYENSVHKSEGMSDMHSSRSNVIGTAEPTAAASGWRKCLPGFLGAKAGELEPGSNGKAAKDRKPFNFRHHQMLNLTSGIGMGLFVTSGRQLAIGGPGSLLINNLVLAIVLFFVSCAMCEMSMRYPISGSFIRYATRFVHPAHGFALGYIYFSAYMFTFGAESNAIAYTLRYWFPEIPFWSVALMFLAVIACIHLSPPHIFAEVEFCIGSFRVISVLGFIIWTIFMLFGFKKGDRHETPQFGEYYRTPGPFNMGIKGLVNAAILAAFSNGGVEIGAVASGDVVKPRFSIPRTLNTYRFRMSLFYICSLFCITLLISSDDPVLQREDVLLSPFVYSLEIYGYPVLAHIFNVNIMLSVLSVANCCIYVCGQMLSVMAEDGNAPKWFAAKNASGKPERAIYFAFGIGIIVVMISAFSSEAFEWLASNTGMVFFMVWISILISYFMYRQAVRIQGDPDTQTPYLYTMRFYMPKVIIGVCILWFLLGGQVYTAIVPLKGQGSAMTFFNAATPLPAWIILVLVFMIFIRRHTRFVRPTEVDLQSHLPTEDPRETAFIHQYRRLPWWRRGLTYIPFVTIPVNEDDSTVIQNSNPSSSLGSLTDLSTMGNPGANSSRRV